MWAFNLVGVEERGETDAHAKSFFVRSHRFIKVTLYENISVDSVAKIDQTVNERGLTDKGTCETDLLTAIKNLLSRLLEPRALRLQSKFP